MPILSLIRPVAALSLVIVGLTAGAGHATPPHAHWPSNGRMRLGLSARGSIMVGKPESPPYRVGDAG